MGDRLTDIAGWFDDLQRFLPSIEPRYLLVALVLQSAQTLLNGLAWRNVLGACYPLEKVSRREIVAAYCGGVGLNAFLPVQAGTIAYLGMSRAVIAGSRTSTILAAAVVQNLFYVAVGVLVWAYLLVGKPGASDTAYDLISRNTGVAIATAILTAAMVAIALRLAWDWLLRLYDSLIEGAAILRTPVRYVTTVLAPQVASYACRVGVNMTFMAAMGIPVSVQAVFLLLAANSISSAIAVTPGGLGTQQALAVVALRQIAPAAAVATYSLTQQAVITAWNIAFGLAVMAIVFGWAATGSLLRHRHGDDRPAPPTTLTESP